MSEGSIAVVKPEVYGRIILDFNYAYTKYNTKIDLNGSSVKITLFQSSVVGYLHPMFLSIHVILILVLATCYILFSFSLSISYCLLRVIDLQPVCFYFHCKNAF